MSFMDNELFDGEDFGAVKQHVRHPFSRLRLQSVNNEESMTLQSEKDLTDINYIVKQFDRSGSMPDGRGPGEYLDVTMLNGDLLEVMERSRDIVERATAFFSEVEAEEAEEAALLAHDNAKLLERARQMMAAANSPTGQPSPGGSGGSPPE